MAKEKIEDVLVPAKDQPYPIPTNWLWMQLKGVVSVSKERTDAFTDSTIRYVGLEHMRKDEGIVSSGSPTDVRSTKNVFHAGQVLYGKLRPYLNKHDVAMFDGICSTDILVFDVLSRSIPQYVNYYLDQREFIRYVVENSKGINLPRVSEKEILSAVIPLPPLPEQQRIVDRIESLFAKMDEAKEKSEAVVDGYEDRKAAILHQAFTGELTAVWRKKNSIPDSWKKSPFEKCISVMQNGISKRKGTDGEPYVVLRLANLTDDGFDTNDLREIFLDEKEQKAYALKPDDVLMIRVNGSKDNVGKLFAVGDQQKWAFCDHIIRMRYTKDISSKYMVYYSQTREYKTYVMDNMVSSAGQNTISRKGMAGLIIPIPKIEEQMEIVDILDRLITQEKSIKEAAEQVISQIDTMKKAILAHAFRGELGTNDPSEPPADIS